MFDFSTISFAMIYSFIIFTPISFFPFLDSSKTFSLDYCNGFSNAISGDRYRNGIEHNSQYVSRANRK